MENNVIPQPPAVTPTTDHQNQSGAGANSVPPDTLTEFDNFMTDNGYTPASANDGASAATPAPGSQPPSGASPAAAPSGDAAPGSQPPATERPGASAATATPVETGAPAGAPAATPEGAQPSAPAAPAAQPAALNGEDKFTVREGADLTRNQISFLLDAWNKGNTRDRATADMYRDTFQMDAEQAKKEWGPIVEFLRTNAQEGGRAPLVMQGVLDALGAGGRGAEEYLERALQTYADHLQQHPQAHAQPRDRELEQRVTQTERAIREQRNQEALQYVAREREALGTEYSCLKDPQIWAMFSQSALPVVQQQPGYTLTQHAQYNKRQLDLWQKAFEAGNTATQPTPAPAPAPAAAVPALVHANGAAPAATRQPVDRNSELRFDTLDNDDVVNEFMRTHPEPLQ